MKSCFTKTLVTVDKLSLEKQTTIPMNQTEIKNRYVRVKAIGSELNNPEQTKRHFFSHK